MSTADPRPGSLRLTYLGEYRHVELVEPAGDELPAAIALASVTTGSEDDRSETGTLLIAPTCQPCLSAHGPRFATGLAIQRSADGLCIVPVCTRHRETPATITLAKLAAWTRQQVLWAELTEPFVGGLLAASDRERGVTRPPIRRRYAHELARGQQAAVFADHLGIDRDGQLWLPTWARIVAGLPGVDVPIVRDADGQLHVDLDRVGEPARQLPDGPSGDFVIPVTRSSQPTTTRRALLPASGATN